VSILLRMESFFATERERTESDSSEMSGCGGWDEIAGGQDNVRGRCRSTSSIFGTDVGNHAFPYAHDGCCGAETYSTLCSTNTKLLNLFPDPLRWKCYSIMRCTMQQTYMHTTSVTNFVGIKIELDVGNDLAVVAARWAEASERNIPFLRSPMSARRWNAPASIFKDNPIMRDCLSLPSAMM
jgi:hypothetical protein